MFDVGGGVVGTEDNASEEYVPGHQWGHSVVCVPPNDAQLDLMVAHHHQLLPGFKRQPRHGGEDVRC